jgi:hypothetical protein
MNRRESIVAGASGLAAAALTTRISRLVAGEQSMTLVAGEQSMTLGNYSNHCGFPPQSLCLLSPY